MAPGFTVHPGTSEYQMTIDDVYAIFGNLEASPRLVKINAFSDEGSVHLVTPASDQLETWREKKQ